MTKLICADCGHENELERIYCHNCGTRLNRSALENEKTATKEEGPAETQKRLRRMVNPRGVKFRHSIFALCKLILGACATAALIQMISPPDLPPQRTITELGPQIGLDLEIAVTTHHGAALSYNEDQVTAYLANTLKRKQKALDKPLLPFERAFVGFDEGVFRLTAARSFFGYALYSGVSYRASAHNGELTARNCGGMIGRMPIHPEIMKYADVIFVDVWKALEQDRKQVAKLQSIEFHPKTVLLTAPLQ